MTTQVTNRSVFDERTGETLQHLKDTGQFKTLQMIEGPMDATVSLRGRGEVACFCSNNYLGLANHPEVVEAAREATARYGASSGSSRLISGHMRAHAALEERIAAWKGLEAALTVRPA